MLAHFIITILLHIMKEAFKIDFFSQKKKKAQSISCTHSLKISNVELIKTGPIYKMVTPYVKSCVKLKTEFKKRVCLSEIKPRLQPRKRPHTKMHHGRPEIHQFFCKNNTNVRFCNRIRQLQLIRLLFFSTVKQFNATNFTEVA